MATSIERERAALEQAKREGWYLAERASQWQGLGGECPSCGEGLVPEVYRCPWGGDSDRHFDVCDACGYSTEVREFDWRMLHDETPLNEALFLARSHADNGCGMCAFAIDEYKKTSADQSAFALVRHVHSHLLEDEELDQHEDDTAAY
jgi:hypothetical protein